MISASRLRNKKKKKKRGQPFGSSRSLDRGEQRAKDNLGVDRNHGRLLDALKNAQVANELSNHSIHWSVACSWEYDIARERGRTLSRGGGSHFSVHSNAGCKAWLTDTLSLRDRQTNVSKRAALGVETGKGKARKRAPRSRLRKNPPDGGKRPFLSDNCRSIFSSPEKKRSRRCPLRRLHFDRFEIISAERNFFSRMKNHLCHVLFSRWWNG